MVREGLLNQWLGQLSRDGSALETRGNRVRLFFEGDEAFCAMREAIESAERYIHQEMYMFQSDEVGWAMAEAFAGAARRGIPVRLVYDAIGSGEASPEIFAMMLEAGVEVECFRPVAPWRKRSGILGRNHRKNLIIDGRIAFTGGMNLGAAWSRAVNGEGAWRDTHLSIEGPGAMGCNQFFKETWGKVGGSAPLERGEFVLGETGPWESDVLVVGGSGFGKREAIRRLYSTTFAMAEKDVVLTVPYFVPPRRMLNRVKQAEGRGIEVDLLVPRNSDVPIADWIREGLYPSLMEAGVALREYTGAVLHAKSMVADDRLAVVGSANFDFLSISMNWELSVVIEDEEVVSQLREQHERDLEESEEVTLDWVKRRPWWRMWLGSLGASVLRKL